MAYKGGTLRGEGGNRTCGNGPSVPHNTWSWGCGHRIFVQAEAEVQQATQRLIAVILLLRAGEWGHVSIIQREDFGHQSHLRLQQWDLGWQLRG